MPAVAFADISAPRPTIEDVSAQHARLRERLDAATTADQWLAVVHDWDQLRRQLDTWTNLTHLHFNQDTRNADYKAARQYCDELTPKLTELDVNMKRRLLGSPLRAELTARLGPQAFALWESQVLTYDPAIEADAVRESGREGDYIELHASARFEFQGESLNLSGLAKFNEHPDRAVRHDAERLRWGWFADHREQLDRLYDDLVRLRTGMARTLGFDNFIGLGYRRMCRVDYTQHDVERFRAEVREHLVPLAVELRRRQAERLGVEKLMFWDEALHEPAGNPRPQGDHDWMLQRAVDMFDAMGSDLGEFFRLLNDGGLLDLKTREGKAGGGFCTSFPTHGTPFIFANFTGSKGDVEVFTHEAGHAYQNYVSRNQPLFDYLWPTYESCEIHSMSLEFLTWPHMERFFGDDAERFRRVHLTQSLLFIPYGVAVDHFQHLVYDRPEATPAERFAMWQEVERQYLPWRDYGDLAHLAAGGLWQNQRHIYLSPFYYIDYTLAQTCALQFWLRAQREPAAALDDYIALCRRGGSAPFQELARGAGLVSPFDAGCLREVVSQARASLAE